MVNVLNLSDKNTHKKTVLDLSYKHTTFFTALPGALSRAVARPPSPHSLRPRASWVLLRASADVFFN